jgi:hypothetical protein
MNAAGDVACYEDDSAAAIIGWPAWQPAWGMEYVLDAVEDRGLIAAFQNVHDALEPQLIRAAPRCFRQIP